MPRQFLDGGTCDACRNPAFIEPKGGQFKDKEGEIRGLEDEVSELTYTNEKLIEEIDELGGF